MKQFVSLLALGAASVFGASVVMADRVPDDLQMTRFSGADVTPSPACLGVSAAGEVYVGVDMRGSLGRGTGAGRIVRLVDKDKDGVADGHTVFAEADGVRGIVSVGTKLYVLHTIYGEAGKPPLRMDLSVLEDADRDGVADGPFKTLVTGICEGKGLERGVDHSTNGIQLGIDGWIYIAVGDFGFPHATGTDGTTLELLGGGVVRVRPDGTEMELYTTGLRNIYDVAIDPRMNVFTRGNTNDGGGWNVRFSHQIQSGEYGYPRLFINFPDEIIPALVDVGGGSGVGAFFLSEPTWPAKYNNQPLMADWGRRKILLHRVTPDGPSFQQAQEDFIDMVQPTDLDVDASGQMFLSAWDGAGFKGSAEKGYIVRVVPKQGWAHASPPDFDALGADALVELLRSQSAVTRLHAQQAILRHADGARSKSSLVKMAREASLPLDNRVAALFTFAQLEEDPRVILQIAEAGDLREYVLRAASDRLPRAEKVKLPLTPFTEALASGTPREQAAAAIALGRLNQSEAAQALLAVPFTKPAPEAGPLALPPARMNSKDRGPQYKLDVQPGGKVYLSVTQVRAGETPLHAALVGAAFRCGPDLKNKWLKDATLLSGDAHKEVNPDGSAMPKKLQRKHVVTVAAGDVLVYQVPNDAVYLQGRAQLASSSGDGAVDLVVSNVPPEQARNIKPKTPRHATPNAGIIVPHVAAASLVRLQAVDACLAAVGTPSEDLALWALSKMHTEEAVSGLLAKLASADGASRAKILPVLARLYQKEKPYDGSWWWHTRPDTRGPYYKPMAWSASERIKAAFLTLEQNADASTRALLVDLNRSNRMRIDALKPADAPAVAAVEQTQVDVASITSKEGAVGKASLEDLILALDTVKGDPARGKAVFTQQGCIACHQLEAGGTPLGPFMGQIGSIMNREQIVTAIIRPGDTISQGFPTSQITMKDGAVHIGFITESNTDRVVIRDMLGKVKVLKAGDVKEDKHLQISMMPPGLANALSLEDFVSLVDFLAQQK